MEGVALAVCELKGLVKGLLLDVEPGHVARTPGKPQESQTSQRETRESASFEKRNAITHLFEPAEYATEDELQCAAIELREGLR